MILQETDIESNEIIIQEFIVAESFEILSVDFGLFLPETRVHKRFLPSFTFSTMRWLRVGVFNIVIVIITQVVCGR